MSTRRRRTIAAAVLTVICGVTDANAQLDPLLYLKKNKPNILVAVETANRMQRDVYNDYLDANIYVRTGAAWEAALGISDANTSAVGLGRYRRKYVGLAHRDLSLGSDKFEATHIETIGDKDDAYTTFDSLTRIALARTALLQAVEQNAGVVRFGLLRTRQSSPHFETPAPAMAEKYNVNEGPVRIIGTTPLALLQVLTDDDGTINRWKVTRPVVSIQNTQIGGPVGPLVAADAAGANTSVLNILKLPTGAANSLLPSGRDSKAHVDATLDNMLDDVKAEVQRLISEDPDCANTVVVLIVGGGEGTTGEDPVAKAKTFLNISNRRIPIHVIGLGPTTAAEKAQLEAIALESGGRYTEITPALVEAAGAGTPIPEFVRALNFAVSQAFANQPAVPGDLSLSFSAEHQVTSPIVGTVNLENATDINGAPLPLTIITHPVTDEKVPQRSNVMVTAGFSLPGFDGKLRAFRVYKPEEDDTKNVGYRFVKDGTRLWVASAPAASSRNIFTALPDGTVVAFSDANDAVLKPYLRVSTVAAAAALINTIRSQGCSALSCPIGAIVGSTPAVMDAPSLDPPPDSDYPGFIAANKNRRGIIWVGANDGMLHAIDARLGKEVWAFIPFNLLPKLRALVTGQPVGDFRYGMDGSPKLADVKVGGEWRSYLVIGQGPGGTFYQAFDVTLDNIGSTVAPNSDSLSAVLGYFSSPASVPLKWSFPSYQHFDVNLGRWGDIAASAPAISKSVGETWSDPAIGQIESAAGRFAVLTGSGFFKYSTQQEANRNGIVAGTTFYLLDVADGAVLDTRNVGSDGSAENVDNCASSTVDDCRKLKNALQADPVASGPPDARFITKAYLGDLDGRIWRFDIGLDAAQKPIVKDLVKLYTVSTGSGTAAEHPLFASMATVNIGSTQQYMFVGTGSDLLPQNKVSSQYALLVVLDQGTSGALKGVINLEKTDGVGGDEKVSAFPAVAGDIVFFSTTTYKQGGCSVPDANLYAFTFIGGPAYDTNNDGKVSAGGKSGPADSPKVQTTTGARATAPFIVDQHLVFGTGNNIEMFGDPADFNNGVGQAGIRILSWREVR